MIDRLQWLAVAAAFGLLTGCGTYSDFGRVRPSLVNDDTHAWMGPAVARGPATNLAWKHQLTEEERMLRDLAYPLIEPPYDRQQWYSVLGELGIGNRPWPYPDRNAYASRLFTTAYRSQTARYNRLIDRPRGEVEERLWRQDRLYDVIVPLGWNDGPVVKGRGSAIFVHVARPRLQPTAGCVALAKPALRRLIARIGPKTTIIIH